MLAPVPAVELELDPLIAEVGRRASRRRFLWACVIGIAAVAAGVVAFRSSGRPGFVALAPTACHTGQLRLALRSGGVGNLGTAAYAVTLRNTSSATCTLSGWPKLRLVMPGGARVTPRPHDLIAFAYSVKHPPPVPRIRLGPGGSAQWYFQAADGTGLHHACRTAEKLLVVPPTEHQSLALAVRVPFCGPHYFWELPIGRSP